MVNSSKSIFSSNNFHLLKIHFKNDQQLVHKVSRSYVQYLEWPYQTNCIKSKIVNGMTYTFEDCLYSYILNKMLKKNSRIHSINSFNIGILLNNETEKIKICDKDIDVVKKFHNFPLNCAKTCRQNCIVNYIYNEPEISRFNIIIRSVKQKNWF